MVRTTVGQNIRRHAREVWVLYVERELRNLDDSPIFSHMSSRYNFDWRMINQAFEDIARKYISI